MTKLHWHDWLLAVIGVWLCVSPFVLTQPAAADALTPASYLPGVWVFLIGGLIALAIAMMPYLEHDEWQFAAGLTLGAILIVSPWLFGFAASDTAIWNAVLSGLGTMVASAFAYGFPHHGSHA